VRNVGVVGVVRVLRVTKAEVVIESERVDESVMSKL
jgi:hypothetical protein